MLTKFQSGAVVRRSVAGALILSFLLPYTTEAATAAGEAARRRQEIAHLQKVEDANAAYHDWVDDMANRLNTYLPKRGTQGGPNEDHDIYIAPKKGRYSPVRKTSEEMNRTDGTQTLFEHYYGHQGPAKRRGIFIESARVWNGEGEWNELRWAGLEVKANRDKFLDACVKLDIHNIRFGIGIETINPNRPESIEALLDFHKEAWKRGIAMTDAILFFSNLREFEVLNPDGSINFDASYYNHKDIKETVTRRAKYYAKKLFTEQNKFNKANSALSKDQKKPKALTAFNIFNEPDTAVGFLLQFWNKAKGLWSHPEYMRWYTKMVVNAASITVSIRNGLEDAMKETIAQMGPHDPLDERILYFHNEAMTPERYPTHQGDLRFAISQFILGDDQLLYADFDKLMTESLDSIKSRFEQNKRKDILNPVEAMILKYALTPGRVASGETDAARREIVQMMKDLRDEHVAFQKKTGKTAKNDTMIMLDYYQQSEFLLKKPVPEIIQSLAANKGELLKKSIGAATEEGFMNVLRQRTHQAEALTGTKIWMDESHSDQIDFARLLSAEDGAVLDKLIGFRNEFTLDKSPELQARRDLVKFTEKQYNENDEHRLDNLFNSLLANKGQLLKQALGVTSNAELIAALNKIGADTSKGGPVVQFTPGQSIRDFLNANERAVYYRAFGFKRDRFLGFLPTHYARQIRAGLRDGIDKILITYIKKLRVFNFGAGELGGPYVPWHDMMLIQSSVGFSTAARETGAIITSLHVGPAVGVPGWMGGPLTGTVVTNNVRGQDGVFKMVRSGPMKFDYVPNVWATNQPWYQSYANQMDNGLAMAQIRIDARKAVRPSVAVSFGAQAATSAQQKPSARAVNTCEGAFTAVAQ